MAAAITHIVLADKVFEEFFNNRVKRDFFVGTSFPDIRCSTKIDRSRTHSSTGSLSQVLSTVSDFQAGCLFHSLLDRVREEYIAETGLYENFANYEHIILAVKEVEEDVFYSKIDDWQKVASYFSEVNSEELGYGVDNNAVQGWHDLLRDYFLSVPSLESKTKFFTGLGFTEENQAAIQNDFEAIKDDSRVLEVVEKLYEKIKEIIKRYQYNTVQF